MASFAVLADDSPGWRPSEYQSELLGWEHRFRFPTAKLLDHEHRLAVLQRDPKPLEQQVWQGIEDIEKKADMKYVTSVERLAIERGMAQGIEKGLEQGREQGRLNTLTRQLSRRFGPLLDAALARLRSATPDQLDLWTDRVLDAPTLEAVLGGH